MCWLSFFRLILSLSLMCRSINILRNVLVQSSHCIKQYLQNDKSSCHVTPFLLCWSLIKVDLSLLNKFLHSLVSLHKSLSVMASMLSTSNNIKCLLVGFAQNTGLVQNLNRIVEQIRPNSVFSHSILWHFVNIQSTNWPDSTLSSTMDVSTMLEELLGVWEILRTIEGSVVADFCWNLFKVSGIGILCHNLPQWFLSRNLPKIDNSQSFKGFHRCYFLCPWCSEILIRSRVTCTLFHPRIFYWLLTAIKGKRYWDFLLSA